MATNTFITPSDVIRDANLILKDDLLVANLANRSIESRFASKVGSTVKVKVPPVATASEFSTTTTADNLTETSVDVTLEKHFYVRKDLTSDELTLSVDDFNTLVVMPSVRGLVSSIENYALARAVGGFSRNLTGTAGNAPSTQAHILAAEKKIFDNKGDVSQLVGIISSTAHASFAALAQFTSADYGPQRPSGLASNSLGKMAGIDWFRSPYSGTFDRGDGADSTAATASGTSGNSYITVASLTDASGTLNAGTRLTINGIAGVTYTVTEDAVIAANAATVYITPALASSPSTATITFETAAKECVVYNPAAFAVAILPGAIVGPNVASMMMGGIGLRIISDVSISTLAGSWVFDLYCGAKVVRPEYGAVLQG